MSVWSDIAAVYAVDRGPSEKRYMIVIKQLPNGTFRNYYNWYVENGREIWSGFAGNYQTLKKARKMVKKHRPSAVDYTELFFADMKRKVQLP